MTQARLRGDVIVAGLLFGTALLLGGGSVAFPIQRILVELAAVAALGWFAIRGWRAEGGKSLGVAMVLLGLTVLLILVQLVPLPPSIWRALPGRQLPASVIDVMGTPDRWMPLSLDPTATQASVFYFLVPLALFVATIRLDRAGQILLLRIFVGFALLNGLLVIFQSQGMSWLTPYMTGGKRPGTGLFANKNHCAALLVMAMPVAAVVVRGWRMPQNAQLAAGAGIVGFFALTVFGCLSRAGLALLPIGLITAAFILAPRRPTKRQYLIAGGIAAVLMVLAFVVLPRTHIVEQSLLRFDANTDERYNFWPDVLTAIRRYLPVGSGLGTFVQVYTTEESLITVHRTYTNHAHSDYMEIALEAGLAGLALVGAFLVWFAATTWRRIADHRSSDIALFVAAATGIVILLLHSTIDYPLRTLALAGAMAVLAGMLASTAPFLSAASPSTRYGRRHKTLRAGRSSR